MTVDELNAGHLGLHVVVADENTKRAVAGVLTRITHSAEEFEPPATELEFEGGGTMTFPEGVEVQID